MLHVLWMNGGLSCDGESVAITAATQPSIEDLVLGALPGVPPIELHWPYLDFQNGPPFMEWFHRAARGELEPFVLVVEGSIADESNKTAGYWTGFGNDPRTGQPITAADWLDRLAPRASAILAAGTCSAYGGIHGMAGNPTGAMGVPDHLGWDWRSKDGVPVVCVPGCPTLPDNLTETLMHLVMHVGGDGPPLELDEELRPRRLFESTVHSGCDRASFYDQSDFAAGQGSPACLVKVGCWGQVVRCNVAKRGWINGVGGCPNVGGICIGCTMPGFPDKFRPFTEDPPAPVFVPLEQTLRGYTLRVAGE
ncbi:hydrogenase expression protein HypE [Actinoplanes lobatus]|nr:hydrogenase expression protein HypE [Actinoplanes lobatus]MBB4754138.1 hydrogenase small subunit [Actinoplanes lobatus]